MSTENAKPIQLFRPRFAVEECLEEIRECLEKGWTGIGFKTLQIEEEWKRYTGLSQAHFLNSATAGLHLAFKAFKDAFGWNDGDEVISTPLTFVSTNHAILYEGLRPVFADVDETLCLSPASIEARITERTRAILYVGLGGNSGRWSEVVDIARKYGLKLILDAAHMAGATYNGRHVGWDADCAIFSFQAVKNLPTADSGMICFSDPTLDEHVRKLSWLGINKDTYSRSAGGTRGNYKWLYDVEDVGFKYHGNSVIAAIALVQLRDRKSVV
jgi:dTDP-4-amino-4,6-dideoxygalactose transaminase